jgi:hypothetical protein
MLVPDQWLASVFAILGSLFTTPYSLGRRLRLIDLASTLAVERGE